MNAKSTASGIGSATIPGALIIGVALLAGSFAGLKAERNHYRAQAARPKPTATVTDLRPAPATTVVVTVTPAPAGVVPASDTGAAMPHTGDGGTSHTQARPPSAPQPSPTASPSAASPARLGVRASASVHINPTGGTR